MAKKPNNREEIEELINEEDFSSDDIEVYKPSEKEEQELVVNEEAYNIIEYIDLEWPAQSIDMADSRIFLGTTPDMSDRRATTDLVQIDIRYTDFEHLNYKKNSIKRSINKLRINQGIFALSDDALTKYDMDLKFLMEIKGRYGFALCATDEYVFVGSTDGFVECYDHNLKQISKFKAHELSIESIAFENGVIFTGSVDHTVKMFQQGGSLIEELINDSEVNCLDIRNGKLVFGDDNGLIHLYDLETKDKETIKWHASPISLIRWRDDEVFATGSDEQVCLWDTTLEADPEFEFHRYLLFVHQGQRFYKDCCFDENKVVVTAENGLCVFEPVSLATEYILLIK